MWPGEGAVRTLQFWQNQQEGTETLRARGKLPLLRVTWAGVGLPGDGRRAEAFSTRELHPALELQEHFRSAFRGDFHSPCLSGYS